MSWNKAQDQMIHELNGTVFSRDPIHKVFDPMSSIDVHNTNYVMELKNREKYNPQDFDGSLIEKAKYDYLKRSCGDKIPGYVCKFKDGSYWAWNLNKLIPTGIVRIYPLLRISRELILNLKQLVTLN